MEGLLRLLFELHPLQTGATALVILNHRLQTRVTARLNQSRAEYPCPSGAGGL